MKVTTLVQGSPEWHNHRKAHWNASDAAAMLGVSPYQTRNELLHRIATGQEADIDANTQKRFDDGHRFEALARPVAEGIIGQDLYPVTGTNGKYSASFDGITMAEETAFEHKTLNAALREVFNVPGEVTGDMLPIYYRVQMEHQLLVSGAERVLFMATDWDGNDNMVGCGQAWYFTDPELRAQLVAGWDQFAQDLADYTPPAEVVPVVGRTPENLPALSVEVVGQVVRSNAAAFKAHAMEIFSGVNRKLETDQDFADADKTVTWCEGVEKRAKAAKEQILGQTADIAEVLAVVDAVIAESAKIRNELDKLVTARKQAIKNEIGARGQKALHEHIKDLEAPFADLRISLPIMEADFGAAMKNKRTIESLNNAVDTLLAKAKIEATAAAKLIADNLAEFNKLSPELRALVPDLRLVINKSTDDFCTLLQSRVTQHQLAVQAEQAAKAAAASAELAQAATETIAPVIAASAGPAPSFKTGVARAVDVASPAVPAVAVTQISAVRHELNQHLNKLSDAELARVLSFVQSRYPQTHQEGATANT